MFCLNLFKEAKSTLSGRAFQYFKLIHILNSLVSYTAFRNIRAQHLSLNTSNQGGGLAVNDAHMLCLCLYLSTAISDIAVLVFVTVNLVLEIYTGASTVHRPRSRNPLLFIAL